jgi:hypothetical protein
MESDARSSGAGAMVRTSLAGCNVTVVMRSVYRGVLSNKVSIKVAQIAALPAL